MAHALKSMELTDEQKSDMVHPIAVSEKPNYPYGLRLSLDQDTLEKLGLDPAEAVGNIGGYVMIHAMACIKYATVSAEESEKDGEPRARIELQIEEMCIDCDEEEEEEKKPVRTLASIYKKAAA